jgi:hypothetical protein
VIHWNDYCPARIAVYDALYSDPFAYDRHDLLLLFKAKKAVTFFHSLLILKKPWILSLPTAFSLCKLVLVSACPRRTGGKKIPVIKKIIA